MRQEALRSGQLDAIIVLINSDSELDLLGFLLMGIRGFLLLGLFVFVFAVLDDAADRRLSIFGDFHQVHASFLRKFDGRSGVHHHILVAVNDSDFASAYPVIDAGGVARCPSEESLFTFNSQLLISVSNGLLNPALFYADILSIIKL